ncbi:tetratricopeptide repeat protein [Sediminicola luteus]|uniref:Uncharacterized protein n=1 Tax=Sediminicola luteus TaxID=319238 RepID=A0A2A4G4S2_9FLAO|nr:hypothetical protein [Sediminicola luteus]PCE62980.1 hypothetical protein B7P33_17035 [Sediminicola luteus]
MDDRRNDVSPARQETFERYLMDLMPSDERLTFEESLKHDPVMAQNFADFKVLFRGVEEFGLRRAMIGFHKVATTKTKARTKYRIGAKHYAIAAGTVLLLVTGIWILTRQSQTERLFHSYYTPDPGLPTVMGNTADYTFYEAMVDYKLGEYDTAIQKWQRLRSTGIENDSLTYFIGSAYLANGNIEKALPLLQRVMDDPKSVFNKDAIYYLGLIHLYNDDREQAKVLLDQSERPMATELRKALE